MPQDRRLGPHRILYEILQALHHASILNDSLANPNRTPFPKQLWTMDHWLCLACDPSPSDNWVHFEMHKLNQFYVGRTAELALQHYSQAIHNRVSLLRSRKISPVEMSRALATATKWGNSNYRKRNSKLSKSPFHRGNLAELEQIAMFNAWTGTGYKGSFQTDKQPPQRNQNSQTQPANNANRQTRNDSGRPTPPVNTPATATIPPMTQTATDVHNAAAAGVTVTPNTGNPLPTVTVPPAPANTNGPPAGTSAEAGTSSAVPPLVRDTAGSTPRGTPQSSKRSFSRLSISPTTFGSATKRVYHEARPGLGGKRGVASASASDSRPHHNKNTKTFPSKKSFSVDLEGKRTKFNHPPSEASRGSPLMAFWYIPKVVKKILFIGDDNLSIPSEVDRDDVQIVSFPLLTTHKLGLLLESFRFGRDSADPGQIPTDVFFSLGLENRGSATSTNNNEISKVLRVARSIFPGAKIRFCKVPHSDKIPESQAKVLKLFNDSVEKRCENQNNAESVPCIPSDQFEVDSHDTFALKWSQRCANAMMKHYLDSLN